MPVLKYRPDESSSWQTVGTTVDGYSKEETDALLANKANTSSVYTKTETDTLLQNKAPAGYGLGGNAKLLTSADNLDNIKENGWYWWYDTRPSGAEFNYCHMRVDNGEAGTLSSVTQTIYRNSGNIVIVRFNDGNTWITEYVNPPMEIGVEYRTTERFLGKPVYVKSVSIDGLPNNSIKTFQWSDSYANVPFFVTGYAMRSNGGSYMSLPTNAYMSMSGSLMNGMVSISAIEKRIAIKTDFDATSFDTVTVCVKYTKTTD